MKGFLVDKEAGYSLNDKVPGRLLNYANNFMNSWTFELSLHKKVYERSVFSFLDYLAELGGLFAFITSVITTILYVVNYLGVFQFLMAELFASREEDELRKSTMSRQPSM